MRGQLPIPQPAQSRRYPPLGKRIVVAGTGSARAAAAATIATLLAQEVDGRSEVVEVVAPHGDELLALVTRRRATLLVLPLGGTESLVAIAEQELALQAVHRACVPVLAVGGTLDGLPRRALLAIDFSDASSRAAAAAVRLLAGDGTATLLHVYPQDAASRGADWDQLLVRGARRRLELMERRLAGAHRPVEGVLGHGDAAHEILGRATVTRADLIALGGASRGMLHRMLASSLTTRIVRGAPCSVLVAPEVERSAMTRPMGVRRHRDRH